MTQSEQRTQPIRRIPDFGSRGEEAAWWDTHSITDYLDELEPVQVRFAEHLSEALTVHLDRDERIALTRRAARQGVSPSALVHMWIKEHLEQEAGRQPR